MKCPVYLLAKKVQFLIPQYVIQCYSSATRGWTFTQFLKIFSRTYFWRKTGYILAIEGKPPSLKRLWKQCCRPQKLKTSSRKIQNSTAHTHFNWQVILWESRFRSTDSQIYSHRKGLADYHFNMGHSTMWCNKLSPRSTRHPRSHCGHQQQQIIAINISSRRWQ